MPPTRGRGRAFSHPLTPRLANIAAVVAQLALAPAADYVDPPFPASASVAVASIDYEDGSPRYGCFSHHSDDSNHHVLDDGNSTTHLAQPPHPRPHPPAVWMSTAPAIAHALWGVSATLLVLFALFGAAQYGSGARLHTRGLLRHVDYVLEEKVGVLFAVSTLFTLLRHAALSGLGFLVGAPSPALALAAQAAVFLCVYAAYSRVARFTATAGAAGADERAALRAAAAAAATDHDHDHDDDHLDNYNDRAAALMPAWPGAPVVQSSVSALTYACVQVPLGVYAGWMFYTLLTDLYKAVLPLPDVGIPPPPPDDGDARYAGAGWAHAGVALSGAFGVFSIHEYVGDPWLALVQLACLLGVPHGRAWVERAPPPSPHLPPPGDGGGGGGGGKATVLDGVAGTAGAACALLAMALVGEGWRRARGRGRRARRVEVWAREERAIAEVAEAAAAEASQDNEEGTERRGGGGSSVGPGLAVGQRVNEEVDLNR
ncbi:hypothetical protein DFJ73DRAFT_935474 [Zopfochytrium polystomum]|nr:hypothetical protein DFJ73DRAFT_935474 [Zopfochytrium polystomum]